METVIVILGPTASGKTGVSIELAKQIGAEIVSADSMQVYRMMDIGTAKPDMAERQGIAHYMLDVADPDEEFSVARYKDLAEGYIDKIIKSGKIPIIAGGTGLYINSLVYNIKFSEIETDWELRKKLQEEASEKGNQHLYERLKAVDPDSAARIHVNDSRRIIRALEVYMLTSKTISSYQAESLLVPPRFDYKLFGLYMNRERLYERINKRVDSMLEKGLIDEVKRIRTIYGNNKMSTAMQGLGYKEVAYYLRGVLTYNEMSEYIKRETRRYAKRQLTWFRRMQNVEWIDMDECNGILEAARNIKDRLARTGIIL